MKQQDLDPRLILDQAPALLFSGRPDGDIDYVNQRWLDEIGAPLEAVEGRGWMNFIHPDDLEEHLRIWQAALASGAALTIFRAIYRVDVPRKPQLSHFGVSLQSILRPSSHIGRL